MFFVFGELLLNKATYGWARMHNTHGMNERPPSFFPLGSEWYFPSVFPSVWGPRLATSDAVKKLCLGICVHNARIKKVRDWVVVRGETTTPNPRRGNFSMRFLSWKGMNNLRLRDTCTLSLSARAFSKFIPCVACCEHARSN